MGYGEGVFVRRRCGLRLGLLRGLLLSLANEGQSRKRQKQKRAEEGDMSGRGLLGREDQAVALFR